MRKTKMCFHCKRELPATKEYFQKNSWHKTGWTSRCKECLGRSFTIEVKAKYGYKICTNCKKELPATLGFYYKADELNDGLRSKCIKCMNKDSEEYQRNNREKVTELQRRWVENNKDRCQDTRDKYRAKNREKILETTRRYRANNPFKVAQMQQNKRSRLAKLPNTLTEEQWQVVKRHFNNECAYCGKTEKLEQDHFIASINGGGYTHNNIICSCRSCNASKNAKDFFQWYPTYKYYNKSREEKILKFLNYTTKNIQQLALFN